MGVNRFFLAPGSRNAPLATAVAARTEAHTTIHFDERGTCFLALGSGKRSGVPAVWITTSGTAVANGLPAVVEASQSFVPLILLTADRPFELRDVGANQAIDQLRIFGRYTRWSVDLPAPSADVRPEVLLSTLDHAYLRAMGPPAGPVHINMPFREPLAPEQIEFDVADDGIERWLDSGTPFTDPVRGHPQPADAGLSPIRKAVSEAGRGLIIAGDLPDRETADQIVALAEQWRWPVLADVASQARLGSASPMVDAHPHFTAKYGSLQAPDVILRFGSRLSSKALNARLKDWRPSVVAVIAEYLDRNDPDLAATHQIVSNPSEFCRHAATWPAHHDDFRPGGWKTPGIAEVLSTTTADETAVNEPGVARLVTRMVPADHVLYLASSMPIRDFDMFADASGNPAWVGANRGASGIDGTVASAVGAAMSVEQRTTIACGDLALLHDLNSLALLTNRADVVVIMNNDGGGIFSFLPIAEYRDVFEPLFGTPHGFSFEPASALFGLRYAAPETMASFAKAYDEALSASRSTLIEIRTDRAENVQLHRDLERRIAALF